MIPHLRPAQIKEWLAEVGDSAPAVVLDVREPQEHRIACVTADGFDLVLMPMASVPARLAELPKDQPIACLCHHGGRSAQVAYFLHNQGYTKVVNIHGGIDAWATEVDPTIPRY